MEMKKWIPVLFRACVLLPAALVITCSDPAEDHYNRGWELGEQQRFEEAIQEFNEAIRLNPKHSRAYLRRGMLYALIDDNRRAIQDFDSTLRIDPELIDVYSVRGIAYEQSGEYRNALDNYSEALRLKSDDHIAKEGRERVIARIRTAEDVVGNWYMQLRSKDAYNRAQAAKALGELGTNGLTVLIEALYDVDKNVRMSAAVPIGLMGTHARPALPTLILLLSDPEREVRQVAALVLGGIGRPAIEAIPLLTIMVRDEHEHSDVRSMVAGALANIVDSSGNKHSLVAALKDWDPRIRSAAVHAIGWLGSSAQDAMPEIELMTRDNDEDVLKGVKWALVRIRTH